MDFQLNLESETVDQACSLDFICVDPSISVRSSMQQMKAARTGAVLVCEDGVLQGIFTERDAMRLLAEDTDLDAALGPFMTRDPVTLSDTDTVGAAIRQMSSGGYRRLPIVDRAGRPQGIVKTSTILHYLVEHFPAVVYNLPPTPDHAQAQSREGA